MSGTSPVWVGRERLQVTKKAVGVVERPEAASSQVILRLPLSRLVPFGPEPHLIDRDRQRRAKLDHAILPFGDLKLSTWLIQSVLAPKFRGQGDRPPPLDRSKTVIVTHITTMQYCCNTVKQHSSIIPSVSAVQTSSGRADVSGEGVRDARPAAW